jgi:outer membrane lipoprotein-sorting protein
MRTTLRLLFLCIISSTIAIPCPAQTGAKATAPECPASPSETKPSGDPTSVLRQMDAASADFKAAQADVELVQCTAVVHETDVQRGQIYFRRKGKGHETQVALWIKEPHPKQAVVKEGKVTFLDQRTKQVTERSLGDNKPDIEAVMNLGFGMSGTDLAKDYSVTMSGWEMLDGVNTARLELVAKSEKLRRLFTKLVLWVDPKRAVALQQQRFEVSGDYQLTHYTNIKMSSGIPDDKFTIKK